MRAEGVFPNVVKNTTPLPMVLRWRQSHRRRRRRQAER
ncbi:unnamed protein product [Laminaria digitata]